jgi:hypothetical protein
MFILFAGTSCTQESEIRSVAKNYLKALVDYRLDDAKKYGDDSAIQFLEGQQMIIDTWTPGQREEARKNLENIEVKITGVDIKDTKATVKYEFIKKGKILQSENLYLVKNSTGWKVYESM